MRVLQLGGLALSLMMAGSALAQEDETAGWSVASRNAPLGGVAVYCNLMMLTGAPSEPNISIRNQPVERNATSAKKQGPAVLRFTIPELVLSGKRVDLTAISVAIEGQKTWKGLAGTWNTRGKGGFVQVVLGDDIQTILKPLARGARLDIGFTPPGSEAKSYSFSLKGSGSAVTAYESCLSQNR